MFTAALHCRTKNLIACRCYHRFLRPVQPPPWQHLPLGFDAEPVLTVTVAECNMGKQTEASMGGAQAQAWQDAVRQNVRRPTQQLAWHVLCGSTQSTPQCTELRRHVTQSTSQAKLATHHETRIHNYSNLGWWCVDLYGSGLNNSKTVRNGEEEVPWVGVQSQHE